MPRPPRRNEAKAADTERIAWEPYPTVGSRNWSLPRRVATWEVRAKPARKMAERAATRARARPRPWSERAPKS
eukprot:1945089-Prymnesium_polylepis.1